MSWTETLLKVVPMRKGATTLSTNSEETDDDSEESDDNSENDKKENSSRVENENIPDV